MWGLVLAVAWLGAPPAHANPIDSFGLGSRGPAMAGALSAVATDFSANYYNPAGLARGRDLRISVGYLWAEPQLAIDGVDNDVDPAHGVSFGAAAPGRAFGIPFAFGIGLYLPDDRVSRVRSLTQRTPRWELYDNRTQRLYLAANLAVEPLAGLSVGAGLSFMSSTAGTLGVRGFVTYPDQALSELRHRVDADLQAVRYPQAGIRWAPVRWLELGAVYRGEFQLDLSLEALLEGSILAFDAFTIDGVRVMLESASVNAFLPQQIVLGAAVRPRADLVVTADLTWIDWSAYESPVSRVRYELTVPIPEELQGSVTIPAAPPGTDPLPPRFRDRVVPRVGAEWRRALSPCVELAVRAGWLFEASPIPEQTGETNFVDSDRHVLSAGLGLAMRLLPAVLPKPLELDVHGQLFLFDERAMRKTDPADPIGDYRADGTVTTGGATLSAVF